jgi:hypothetical protein
MYGMNLRKRLDRLEGKQGSDDEVHLVRWEDGRKVAVLDLRATGVTWPHLFESVSDRGRMITG